MRASARELVLGDSDAAGIDPAKDSGAYQWQVLALDRASGKTVWSRTVHQGVPRVKRHVKGSHASATPATDGRDRRRDARLGRARRVRHERHRAVAQGSRRAGRRSRRRSDVRVGARQLAGDPRQRRARAERSLQAIRISSPSISRAARSCGARRRDELPAWATPLVHTGDHARDRRHQLAALHPRPRLQDRPRAVARRRSGRAGQGEHAGRGRRRWRSLPAAGRRRRGRFSRSASPTDRSRGATNAARPTPARRSFTTGSLYILTDNGILSAYQVSRRCARLPAAGVPRGRIVLGLARRRRRPALLRQRGRQGVSSSAPAGRSSCWRPTRWTKLCMATPAPSGNLLFVRTSDHLYALGARN